MFLIAYGVRKGSRHDLKVYSGYCQAAIGWRSARFSKEGSRVPHIRYIVVTLRIDH